MSLGEFALIRQYFSGIDCGEGVVTGVGDDAAVVEVSPGHQLVTAIDTLVAGVHFPVNANPADIAKRCLRVNLSDLAAMGAKPKWFTLALTLPEADPNWLAQFSKGLAEDAVKYRCSLVGGDTTCGPLTISIAMMGEVLAGKALCRSGAKPGDNVYVTGSLGAAAASLKFLDVAVDQLTSWQMELLRAYYLPEPRIKVGELLVDIASSMIDISDGLMADAGHIAQSSGVGLRLEYEKLPVAQAVSQHFSGKLQQQWVLSGGDDYELIFTVPANNEHRLAALVRRHDFSFFKVGLVEDGIAVYCVDVEGKSVDNESLGYQHF